MLRFQAKKHTPVSENGSHQGKETVVNTVGERNRLDTGEKRSWIFAQFYQLASCEGKEDIY